MKTVLTLALVLLATPAWSEEERRYYKTDARQMRVLELSNLSDGTDCHPNETVGRVIKLRYDDELAVTITGMTIQTRDGDRVAFNVEQPSHDLGMVTQGWIVQGFKDLLKVGKKVRIGFYMCGAAGRFWDIHSIRPAR
jgi:hypothetical protein